MRENTDRIKVLIVDDHPIVREGIRSLVARESDMESVGEVGTVADAVARFQVSHPDVTLMDLRLPDGSGVTAIRRIRAETPGAAILVLTTFDGDASIREALDAGARGYMLKDANRGELLDAIRAVAAGCRRVAPAVAVRLAEGGSPPNLTAREMDVLKLLSRGLANRQIAKTLGLSAGTVKVYVANILDKLDVTDRTAAVTAALRRGILSLD